MAPKGVANQMTRNIRRFIWEGEKTNTKIFHLVNTSTVCPATDKGELVIRNPSFMHVSLGAKVVWHLIYGTNEWWKISLLSGYFNHSILHCLDTSLSNTKGSLIWKLIKEDVSLIQSQLSSFRGNVTSINLWTEIIMGNPPLRNCEDMRLLRDWGNRSGLIKVFDLSN
jgi:hypothetical protein